MTAQIQLRDTEPVSAISDAQIADIYHSHRLLRGLQQRIGLVRVAFGLIWAIDAWYKWQPAFIAGFSKQFGGRVASTAPAILKPWFAFWPRMITPHAPFFAIATALAETAIAVCLVLGFARRPVYLLGALFAFMIWAVPEAFGRFWTSGQTDLGTGIMYVFIFAALYFIDSQAGAGGRSLDRWIEQRWSGWSAIAEP